MGTRSTVWIKYSYGGRPLKAVFESKYIYEIFEIRRDGTIGAVFESKYITIYWNILQTKTYYLWNKEGRGRGGTRLLYWENPSILNILSIVNTDYSFNWQLVHLTVCSSWGRSRYIDISMIFILIQIQTLIFCHSRSFCHDRTLHWDDWCPSIV